MNWSQDVKFCSFSVIQKSFVKKYVLIRKGWLKKEGCSGKDGCSSKKKYTKLFLNKKDYTAFRIVKNLRSSNFFLNKIITFGMRKTFWCQQRSRKNIFSIREWYPWREKMLLNSGVRWVRLFLKQEIYSCCKNNIFCIRMFSWNLEIVRISSFLRILFLLRGTDYVFFDKLYFVFKKLKLT